MYYFLVNPASKSSHGTSVWKSIEEYLMSEKVEYKVYFSKRPGHMQQLMYDICNEHSGDADKPNIVVVGGDGSFNEAIQGVISFDKVNIGHIPTGSGNDFARAMDYSSDPIENVKRILNCHEPMKLDLGKLKYENISGDRSRLTSGTIAPTRYFNISCGIGFDAAVCEEALASKAKNVLNKFGLGKLIYLFTAVKQVFGATLCDAILTMDTGEKVQLKNCRLIVGMNTRFEGGGMKFAPDANPTDGYLDVCTVGNISSLKILFALPGVSKGKHLKLKQFKIFKVRSYEVITNEPLWVHTDGEVHTKADRIKVSVIPGGLNFLW